MYILLIALLLVLLLLFAPIKVVAELKDDFDFYIRFLFFKIKFKNKQQKKSSKKNKEIENKKTKSSFSVIKKIASLIDEIKEFAAFFAQKCVVVDNLVLKVEFGTDNAAHTGMATGILNGAAYGAVAAVHQNVRLKKWTVDIVPDFEKEKFKIEFLCIATTRLLHIMNIGIKGLKLYKKFRAK